jgi:hypothetical protein
LSLFTYSEHVKKMNKTRNEEVLEGAIRALNDLGLTATALRRTNDPTADAFVVLRRDGKRFRYQAEIKRRITPALIGAISVAFAGAAEDRLLITDYATPPVADALRRKGVQFVDSAGNAFLERNGILVFVTGRSRPVVMPMKTMRVFRPSGLKVLFVLLSVPQAVAAPLRTIAHAADVALGSVARVMRELGELGFVVEIRGTVRLVNRDRLIDQWTEAYARTLQPSLQIGRFIAQTPDWWRRADPARYGAQWGGETAAATLQRHLVPEQTIVYAEEIPPRMMSDYRLRADANGPIIFRRRFWNDVPSPRSDVVPPLLVYADLLTTDDQRSVKAAKDIRDAYLV